MKQFFRRYWVIVLVVLVWGTGLNIRYYLDHGFHLGYMISSYIGVALVLGIGYLIYLFLTRKNRMTEEEKSIYEEKKRAKKTIVKATIYNMEDQYKVKHRISIPGMIIGNWIGGLLGALVLGDKGEEIKYKGTDVTFVVEYADGHRKCLHTKQGSALYNELSRYL